jgi:glycosyltransferase involved in cell wall biosynthesis
VSSYNGQVSICIPAYNAGKYISFAIGSLIAQSYSNIEIIVSDNASTDSTREIVEGYMLLDKRVRCLANETNVGYCGNIARLIEAAANEIVAVFHADDVYEPTIIEEELLVLNQRQDIAAVFTKYRHFEESCQEAKTEIREAWENMLPLDASASAYWGALDEFVSVLFEIGNPFCCPSLMTRKSDYLAVGGFSEKYPTNEDLELWVKYLQSGRMLAIVASTLVNYRHSKEQGSAQWGNRLELPVYFKVIDEMLGQSVREKSASSEKYKMRKASGWIDLALRLDLSDPKRRELLGESERTYRFSLYTEKGLIQKFPVIYEKLRAVLSLVRGFLKRKTPKMYGSMKLIYYRLLTLTKTA